MKKWLRLLLSLTILLTFLPIQAAAEDETAAVVSTNWRYESTNEGICIIGYNGTNTNVVIPDTIEGTPVVKIGESAFRGGQFISVTIPNSVISIGKYAFRACTNLKSVVLPEGLTSIETGVFAYCSELSNVIIPNSVTTIGTRAFYFCESLTEITLPKNLTTIKNGAFSCSGLKNVVIPDDVSTLDVSVFEYCVNLRNITIGGGLRSIFGGQFDTCVNLHGVWIGEDNPYYCSDEYGIVYNKDRTKVVLAPRGITGHCVIPDGVTEIDDHAFLGCQKLTGVTIPDSIATIGESAFQGCAELAEVTIPDGVKKIGNSAFTSCTNLTDITIGASVEYFNGSMLDGCNSLTEIRVTDGNRYYDSDEYGVLFNESKTELIKAPGALNGTYTVPNGVVTIADQAFFGCAELSGVIFPDGVTGIGESAFSGCTALAHVVLPDGVKVLQGNVFSDCTALTSVSLPDGLEVIGSNAFSSCVSLTSITIPDGVTTIESGAFVYCSGLKEVTFGNGLTSIGNYAFADCTSLISVAIPDSVTCLGNGAYMGCSGLTEASLGAGLSSIGSFLFCDCVQLKNIKFGENITSIGEVAFGSTGFVEFDIPEGVTSVGDRAFYGCAELREISISASVSSIGDGVFSNCGLQKVRFCGDAVYLHADTFYNVVAKVYYPAGNETWTSDVMRPYGGNLTWIAFDGNFTISGANVLLGSSLGMNFFVDKDFVSRPDYYAVIIHFAQDGTYTYNIPYDQWDERKNYMVVTLDNLSAKQMADRLEVCIYHSDGRYASQPWNDSIRDYAMRIFDRQDNKTKTLLVDMLNYGTEAQTYFRYNESDPANSRLSEEQLAYGTRIVNCTDKRVEGNNYYGSTLTLKNRIQLTMYFQNITTDMYAVVRYIDHYGNTEEYRVFGSEFARYNSNTYGVIADTLAVADGDQLVTVIVYDANGNQVAMAKDSVNGYLSRMMSRDALFEATARFTASAYAYFH